MNLSQTRKSENTSENFENTKIQIKQFRPTITSSDNPAREGESFVHGTRVVPGTKFTTHVQIVFLRRGKLSPGLSRSLSLTPSKQSRV